MFHVKSQIVPCKNNWIVEYESLIFDVDHEYPFTKSVNPNLAWNST